MTIIVLCAGGHARVVLEALRSMGTEPVGATDSSAAREGQDFCGIPIIGGDDALDDWPPGTTRLANGLGNRARRDDSGLAPRRQLFERMASAGYQFPPVISRHAMIASDAILEAGAQVMAGAIVQSGARIGANTIVNSGAVVEHDCQVGGHCHVAPGAILCGGVVLDEEVHVGAGAVLLQNVTIGRQSTIAAGTVVSRNVARRGFAMLTEGH